MATLVRAGDILGGVTFVAAFVLLLATPVERDGAFSPAVKWSLASALAIFVFLTGTDALGHAHMGSFGELFEDHVETLQAVLALGAVFVLYSRQLYQDEMRAHRALARSHDLMMGVVDQAPAGILLLDPGGRITFANAAAKHILDLEETTDCTIRGPGWVVQGLEDAAPDSLAALVQEESFAGRELRLEWPNGWFAELRASGRPLSDSRDRLGGIVVTFEKV